MQGFGVRVWGLTDFFVGAVEGTLRNVVPLVCVRSCLRVGGLHMCVYIYKGLGLKGEG